MRSDSSEDRTESGITLLEHFASDGASPPAMVLNTTFSTSPTKPLPQSASFRHWALLSPIDSPRSSRIEAARLKTFEHQARPTESSPPPPPPPTLDQVLADGNETENESSPKAVPPGSFGLDVKSLPCRRTSQSARTAVVLRAAYQIVQVQRRQLNELQRQVKSRDNSIRVLESALRAAEARAAAPRPPVASPPAAATDMPAPARARSSSSATEPTDAAADATTEWQRVEALALELDVLNWCLGEGPAFSRADFWREALPRGAAMLAACGEDAELACVAAVAWRATVEVAHRSPQPPERLVTAFRRARDRVNLRLTRSLTHAGSQQPSAERLSAWLGSLRPELPPLPLSLCTCLRDEVAGAEVAAGEAVTTVLVAPERRTLRCVNDAGAQVDIEQFRSPKALDSAGLGSGAEDEDEAYPIRKAALLAGEVWRLARKAEAGPGAELHLRVREAGGSWQRVIVRFEPCDSLSQYGRTTQPRVSRVPSVSPRRSPRRPRRQSLADGDASGDVVDTHTRARDRARKDDGAAADAAFDDDAPSLDGSDGEEARSPSRRRPPRPCQPPVPSLLLSPLGAYATGLGDEGASSGAFPLSLLSRSSAALLPAARSPLILRSNRRRGSLSASPAAAAAADEGCASSVPMSPAQPQPPLSPLPPAQEVAEAAAAVVSAAREAFGGAVRNLVHACEAPKSLEVATAVHELRTCADACARAAQAQLRLCASWEERTATALSALTKPPPPTRRPSCPRKSSSRPLEPLAVDAHEPPPPPTHEPLVARVVPLLTSGCPAGAAAVAAALEARGATLLADVAEAVLRAPGRAQSARQLRRLDAADVEALIEALEAAAAASSWALDAAPEAAAAGSAGSSQLANRGAGCSLAAAFEAAAPTTAPVGAAEAARAVRGSAPAVVPSAAVRAAAAAADAAARLRKGREAVGVLALRERTVRESDEAHEPAGTGATCITEEATSLARSSTPVPAPPPTTTTDATEGATAAPASAPTADAALSASPRPRRPSIECGGPSAFGQSGGGGGTSELRSPGGLREISPHDVNLEALNTTIEEHRKRLLEERRRLEARRLKRLSAPAASPVRPPTAAAAAAATYKAPLPTLSERRSERAPCQPLWALGKPSRRYSACGRLGWWGLQARASGDDVSSLLQPPQPPPIKAQEAVDLLD